MRCNVGDLAVIVKAFDPENIGRIVEVVTLAPMMFWNIDPDGNRHCGGEGAWMVRSCGRPLNRKTLGGDKRTAMYGVWLDHELRPIRSASDPVETERNIEAVV